LFNQHQHALSLGNDKPEELVVVESLLWETFVGIAAGKDVELTLTRISANAHSISKRVQSETARRGWFVEGMLSAECFDSALTA
jgi:hypothetical protein